MRSSEHIIVHEEYRTPCLTENLPEAPGRSKPQTFTSPSLYRGNKQIMDLYLGAKIDTILEDLDRWRLLGVVLMFFL